MDKNTITGFVLIILVLFGFAWWQQPSKEEIAKQENTELVCAFCKEKYHFSQKEITDLLDNLK